jgi:hypothetical protein
MPHLLAIYKNDFVGIERVVTLPRRLSGIGSRQTIAIYPADPDQLLPIPESGA